MFPFSVVGAVSTPFESILKEIAHKVAHVSQMHFAIIAHKIKIQFGKEVIFASQNGFRLKLLLRLS